MKRPSIIADFLAEPVRFGPFVLVRSDVALLVEEETGDRRAADFFAYRGCRAVDAAPIALVDARRALAGECP